MTTTEPITGELADLITALRTNRDNLRHTVRGLDDEQAGLRTTVSALTLGGLVKHLAHGERQWMDFAVGGPRRCSAARSRGASGRDRLRALQRRLPADLG